MDFAYLVGALVYIGLSVTIVGFLPSEFFVADLSGLNERGLETAELNQYLNQSAQEEAGLVESVGFFKKLGAFIIGGWTIPGVPALVSLVLLLFNIVSVAIPLVFVYDKVRGIS
jgi:hypothetical protein